MTKHCCNNTKVHLTVCGKKEPLGVFSNSVAYSKRTLERFFAWFKHMGERGKDTKGSSEGWICGASPLPHLALDARSSITQTDRLKTWWAEKFASLSPL